MRNFDYPFLEPDKFGKVETADAKAKTVKYNNMFQAWIDRNGYTDRLKGCRAVWSKILDGEGLVLIPRTKEQADFLGNYQSTIESSLVDDLRNWFLVEVFWSGE